MKLFLRNRATGLLVVVGLLLIWEGSSRWGVVNSIFLPTPSRISSALYESLFDDSLYYDMVTTIYRFAVGFALGCIIAIPFGIAMGLSRRLYYALEPTIELLRPIPASALIPVALLFLGLGDGMVFAIVAVAVIWPVLINTIDGVRSVEPLLVDTGRILGLKPKRLIRKVVIPASLPSIITGMRISLALSVVLVIVVEMLVGDQGLGHRVINAERTFRFAEMYGTIFLIGVLGYSANRFFLVFSNRAIGWHNKSKGRTGGL